MAADGAGSERRATLQHARHVLQRAALAGRGHVRRLSPGRRLAPAFVVAGAQKAGTTSLYAQLCEHPRVVAASSKEIHYFDVNYHRAPGWYLTHFPKVADGDRRVTGEATPYYLFHPHAAARLAGFGTFGTVVVLLRDPVARAVSHWNHARRHGFEPLDLLPALEAEASRLEGADHAFRADPLANHWGHQHASYLARSLYLGQLERYWRHFGRDRVLTFLSEDLAADPQRVCDEIFGHLGLGPHPVSTRRENARTYPPIDPRALGWLAERLRPEVDALAQALGRDIPWQW